MRLFAAVVPPPGVLAELAAAVRDVDDRGLRFVPAHQRHLTVAFYGDVPDGRVDELTERLRRAAGRTPTVSLQLRGFGAFPRAAQARVLWAGITGEFEVVTRLAERAAAAGGRIGLPVEQRRYRPHVTLARARQLPVDLTAVTTHPFASTPWTATDAVLFRSTLGAHVTHEPLATLPFLAGETPR